MAPETVRTRQLFAIHGSMTVFFFLLIGFFICYALGKLSRAASDFADELEREEELARRHLPG